MDGKDFVNVLDMKKGLAYNCEVENKYLSEEIAKCLYKRGVFETEFNIIVDKLNHLDKDIELNEDSPLYGHTYYEGISNDIDRLKEIVNWIGYYDMHIADYRKHIKHNNRLLMMKNKKN